MSLKEYHKKRNFNQTPEPKGEISPREGLLRFVIQKHDASRIHFDLRLELGGTYYSWAVPKVPSLNPSQQRLAVKVENHPIEYGRFEGIIPKGNYGAGTVMIWDYGTYTDRKNPGNAEESLIKGLESGKMSFILNGQRLKGEFILVRTQESQNWLLMKKRDQFASYHETIYETSVVTGRSMTEIASQASDNHEVWVPGDGQKASQILQELNFPEENISVQPPSTGVEINSLKRGQEGNTRVLEQATQEAFPMTITMMEPVISQDPFDERGWIFQPIYDGIRALIFVNGVRSKIISRRGLDLSQRFPDLYRATKSLRHKIILDTELFFQAKGSSTIMKRPKSESFTICHLLDILHANGKNLRMLPLGERLKCLETYSFTEGALFIKTHDLEAPYKASPHKHIPTNKSILGRDLTSSYQGGIHHSWQTFFIDKRDREKPLITNLSRIYFPELGLTKKDIINYYESVAPYILPHLQDRPQSMHRHPNGIYGESFYHKDVVGYVPSYVSRVKVSSENRARSINYLLCQNLESILYMVGLGCIEFHPFFSRKQSLEKPDYSVIDLDPDQQPFSVVVEVARTVHQVLEECGIPHLIKTSGASGIHIIVPLSNADFQQSLSFASKVCSIVQQRMPETTTTERSKSRRKRKLYLDAFQNRRSSTIASVYSLRPEPHASVSMPLHPFELKSDLKPQDFTIKNAVSRLKETGDLFEQVLTDEGIEVVDMLPVLEELISS